MIIELLHAGNVPLDELVGRYEGVEVIDAATLVTSNPGAGEMGNLLAALEAEQIPVKQIRYGTTNLEALFLRLTSQDDYDV